LSRFSKRWWWGACGLGSALLLATLGGMTVLAIGLERAEWEARAEATHHEALRLALWRIDSWMAPHLAAEAARPYFSYSAFYSRSRSYGRLLQEPLPGEPLTPSPLLELDSELFRLHFMMGPDGRLSSPQVPEGWQRELAGAGWLEESRLAQRAETLELLRGRLSAADLGPPEGAREPPFGAGGRASFVSLAASDDEWGEAEEERAAAPRSKLQRARSKREWAQRKRTYDENLEVAARAAPDPPAPTLRVGITESAGSAPVELDITAAAAPEPKTVERLEIGSFAPRWIGADRAPDEGLLIFARSVRVGQETFYQGFLCDWKALRGALVAEISDLFPRATLRPLPEGGSSGAALLATLPAALEAELPALPAPPPLGPVRLTLVLAWLVVPAGVLAIALAMRAAIAFGRKRSRFASAVTHELRTPLTTFQLYTEMLADEMVTAADQRRSYLRTLKEESTRLARLVENVLAYARLEEGRRVRDLVSIGAGELVARLGTRLERRAAEAGAELRVHPIPSGDAALETDLDAAEQILGNLVDNACKYGSRQGPIELRARIVAATLRIRVEDHGPGIGTEERRSIFEPFERGAAGTEDKPGLGLGLALSRDLARDLGGDLLLDSVDGEGAAFELRLPI